MATPEEINDAISNAAASGEKSVTIGGETVMGYSLDELIRAAEYLANKDAVASNPAKSIRRVRNVYQKRTD